MAEAWNIEQDLWEQCEFQRRYTAPPKPSKHVIQGRASLFDDYSDVEDEETPEPPEPLVKYVRGRPLAKPVKEKKPGGVPSMFSDEETFRQIREVSGMGYSNEHIVRTLKREQLCNRVETPPPLVDASTTPSAITSGSTSDSSTSSYHTDRSTPPFMRWKPVSIDITNKKEFPSLNK